MIKSLRVLIINLMLFVFQPQMAACADIVTNGVYCEQGKTMEIDKSIHEFTPTNKPDLLYFSNDLIIKVNTNADFMVNSFFQELSNTNSFPEKLKTTSNNFAATLNKGTVIVTYTGGNENSSCIISTPFTDHELSKGTFYFQVIDNKVIVFTIDGSLKSSSGNSRSTTTTPTGYAAIAVQNDSNGILDSKVSFYTDKVKQSVIDKLTVESKDVTNLKNSVMFIRIDGKTAGIVIN
jgi:hypothetical protein